MLGMILEHRVEIKGRAKSYDRQGPCERRIGQGQKFGHETVPEAAFRDVILADLFHRDNQVPVFVVL